MSEVLKVALVGNPNVGKSTIFNHLTGLNQGTGNFPGITVDKKIGAFTYKGKRVEVIDFPGTYSLYPSSKDEKVVWEVLTNSSSKDFPDLIVYVADAFQLDKSLLLFSQILDLGLPTVLCVNMIDVAERNGIAIDTALLQERLNVPVFQFNGRTGDGIIGLKEFFVSPEFFATSFDFLGLNGFLSNNEAELPLSFDSYQSLVDYHHAEALHGDKVSVTLQMREVYQRYQVIDKTLKGVLEKKFTRERTFTSQVDEWTTHPLFGGLIFLGILLLLFQAIFSWSEFPMELLDSSFGDLSAYLLSLQEEPSWWLRLVAEGLVSGIGGVLVFIPQIAILFCFISILEESGYMSRAVFLSDRVMQKFGLNGRSLVSLISGMACAIPAIMATRTISNWKERLITILVLPLISCSARIPVFTLLIALAVPSGSWLYISYKAWTMVSLYAAGTFLAVFGAWVLHKVLDTDEEGTLMLELPPYQIPSVKTVFLTAYQKTVAFVVGAGQVILIVSIVLWFLASYSPYDKEAQIVSEVTELVENGVILASEMEGRINAQKIEYSYAGILGKAIEPVIEPLGYDWKIGIGIISSFAAREVFVGTLATIYSVEDPDNTDGIIAQLSAAKTVDGEKVYTTGTVLSLLVFFLISMQCVSTLAVVKRETKSWKWPIVQFVSLTGVAYLASFLVYLIV